MTRSLLSLAVLLLALTGCREYVVDPEPLVLAPPPRVPAVLLKGPETTRVGDPYVYKVDGQNEVRYEWSVQGPAGLSGDGDGTRFFTGTALATGSASVRVYLRDYSGEIVGYGERAVEVIEGAAD